MRGKIPEELRYFPIKTSMAGPTPHSLAWPSGLCSLLHDLCSSGNGRNLTAEIKITMVPSLVNNGPCSSTFYSCVQSSEGILFGDQERSFPRKLVCSSWNREKNSVPSANLTPFAEHFMKLDKIHHLVWLCSHFKSVYQYCIIIFSTRTVIWLGVPNLQTQYIPTISPIYDWFHSLYIQGDAPQL